MRHRNGPLPARPGPHHRSTDPRTKSRAYPTGSARFRLLEVLRTDPIEVTILRWLTARGEEGTRADESWK